MALGDVLTVTPNGDGTVTLKVDLGPTTLANVVIPTSVWLSGGWSGFGHHLVDRERAKRAELVRSSP